MLVVEILELAGREFGASPDRLASGSSDHACSRARKAAVWVARTRRENPPPYKLLGRLLKRDHSTIKHAFTSAERLRGDDHRFREATDGLLERARGDAPLPTKDSLNSETDYEDAETFDPFEDRNNHPVFLPCDGDDGDHCDDGDCDPGADDGLCVMNLTNSEQRLLGLRDRGLSHASIAERLQLSPKYVANTLSKINGSIKEDQRREARMVAASNQLAKAVVALGGHA